MLLSGFAISKLHSSVNGVQASTVFGNDTLSIAAAFMIRRAIVSSIEAEEKCPNTLQAGRLPVLKTQLANIDERLPNLQSMCFSYGGDEFRSYIVKSGDYLGKIAKSENTTVGVLSSLNKYIFSSGDLHRLTVGELLLTARAPKICVDDAGRRNDITSARTTVAVSECYDLCSEDYSGQVDRCINTNGNAARVQAPENGAQTSELTSDEIQKMRSLSLSARLALVKATIEYFWSSDYDDAKLVAAISETPQSQAYDFLVELNKCGFFKGLLRKIDVEYLPQLHNAFIKVWLKTLSPLVLQATCIRHLEALDRADLREDRDPLVFQAELLAQKEIFLFSDYRLPFTVSGQISADVARPRSFFTVTDTSTDSEGTTFSRQIEVKYTFFDIDEYSRLRENYRKGRRSSRPEKDLKEYKHVSTHSLDLLEPIGLVQNVEIPIIGQSRKYFICPAIFCESVEYQRDVWRGQDATKKNLFFGSLLLGGYSVASAGPLGRFISGATELIHFAKIIIDENEAELIKTAAGRSLIRVINALDFVATVVDVKEASYAFVQMIVTLRKAVGKVVSNVKASKAAKEAAKSFDQQWEDDWAPLLKVMAKILARKPLSKAEFVEKYGHKFGGGYLNGKQLFSKEEEIESAWKVYNDAATTEKELVMGSLADTEPATEPFKVDGVPTLPTGFERLSPLRKPLPFDNPLNGDKAGKPVDVWTPAVNEAWVQGAIDGQKTLYFGSYIRTPNRYSNLTAAELEKLDVSDEIDWYNMIRRHKVDGSGTIIAVTLPDYRLRITALELKQLKDAGYCLSGSEMIPFTNLVSKSDLEENVALMELVGD